MYCPVQIDINILTFKQSSSPISIKTSSKISQNLNKMVKPIIPIAQDLPMGHVSSGHPWISGAKNITDFEECEHTCTGTWNYSSPKAVFFPPRFEKNKSLGL